MRDYSNVLLKLGQPLAIANLSSGRVRLPAATYDQALEWYGFPPALIPIFMCDSGPTYYGYWKHWFVEREPTFVRMHLNMRRRVFEVARTPDQFLCLATIISIVAQDDVTDSIREFANQLGVSNLDEIDRVTQITGDRPTGFTALPQFRLKTPLESMNPGSSYDGDFPTKNERHRTIERPSCVFETDRVAPEKAEYHVGSPGLSATSAQLTSMFYRFADSGRYGEAWLTLNSHGWQHGDAIEALMVLSAAHHNDAFSDVCSVWCDLASRSAADTY